ncbi:MAG: PASTA domain-containing protein [bacterium]
MPKVSPMTPKEKKLFKRAFTLLSGFCLVAVVCGALAMHLTELHQSMIVPKIIGMELGQARQALASKALKLEVIKSQYDEHVPEGLLMLQSPNPNSYLRRGQTVQAVLSKGDPKVNIPSVVGLSYQDAQILLASNRLRVGKESLINSTVDAKDMVLAQDPEAAGTVDAFTAVDILVSAGPRQSFFVMPDLKNKSLENAFKLLRPAGITIQKIKSEVHDDLNSETVLVQTPPAGTKLRDKDQVSLTISAKSSDANRKARYATIQYNMPDGNPRRLQIDVFDGTGTRTIYNRMESPDDHVEVGVTVSGKASAEIYLNQEFIQEIPIN